MIRPPQTPANPVGANRISNRDRAPLKLDIIICTRERPDSLLRCLEHIRVAHGGANAKVIVCDNRPTTNDTRQLADRFGAIYRAVFNGGKSTALNQVISESDADIIGLLDDDDYIHVDWIGTLLELFSGNDVQFISGLRQPFGELSPTQNDFERRGGFSKGQKSRVFDCRVLSEYRFRGVPLHRIGLGGNCGLWRSAFVQVGGYDTLFGPGEAIWAGESTEICYRMLKSNYRLMYSPSLRCRNLYVDDSTELTLRYFRYGIADTAIHTKIFYEFGAWGSLHEFLWSKPARQSVKIIKSTFRQDGPSLVGLLVELVGNLLGPWVFAFSVSLKRPKQRYVQCAHKNKCTKDGKRT